MRLAICIYKLSRRDYNYTFSEMTGVGESTVTSIVNEVTQTIVQDLWTTSVSNFFRKNQGDFSNMIGEIDSE